jgi:AcrR family transcriptional regulator
MGLREDKKQKSRQALARAALELFSEQGFERTTVDAIAERAGVSRRSFFRYFASKEAAAFPNQEERLRRFEALLESLDVRNQGFSAIREAAFAIAREYQSEKPERAARQKLVDSSPTLALYEQTADLELERIIVRAIAGDGSDPSAERRARVVAACVIGTIRVTLREWFDKKCKPDLLELGAETFGHLEHGFGRKTG